MAGRLAGKVAVVTGGASGYRARQPSGSSQARGADLVIVDRELANLPGTSGSKRAGEPPLLLEGDVGDEAAVECHAAAIAERFGGFDVLLACAGWSNRRERRGHHPRRMGGGAQHEPHRKLPLVARGDRFDAGPRRRRHHPHRLPARLLRRSAQRGVHRVQGRGRLPRPNDGGGPRFGGDPGQRDRPRRHPHPALSNRACARRRTRRRRRPSRISRHPLGKVRPAGGGGAGRALPRERRLLVHHRFVPDGGRRLDRRLTSRRALHRTVREKAATRRGDRSARPMEPDRPPRPAPASAA